MKKFMNDYGDKIEIEADVPLPAAKNKPRFPFGIMKIGESFYAPLKTSKVISYANAYTSTTTGNGKKFTTRKEGNGCRCWRIA